MKIGVIAGTPVDTRMGVEYVERHGHRTVSRAGCPSLETQFDLQKRIPDILTARVISLCNEMAGEGAEGIYINCNSMSAAVNMRRIREEVRLSALVTPFDVYEECAHRYGRIAAIAANGQSLGAIERVIAEQNPACVSFGASLTPLVFAIEAGRDPKRILRECGVPALLEGLEALGPEALILGCTHFPYIAEEIAKICPLPLIDPSGRMLALLTGEDNEKIRHEK
jgi:glutamate racemase